MPERHDPSQPSHRDAAPGARLERFGRDGESGDSSLRSRMTGGRQSKNFGPRPEAVQRAHGEVFCKLVGAVASSRTSAMSEFTAQPLLKTPTVAIQDVDCRGTYQHRSSEECTAATQLVFPYRGVYVRHLGQDQAVAEANQVVFFNATE